jgi:hypothetical protein
MFKEDGSNIFVVAGNMLTILQAANEIFSTPMVSLIVEITCVGISLAEPVNSRPLPGHSSFGCA